MEKSYNPFKMFGSYAGVVVILLSWSLSIIIQMSTNQYFYSPFFEVHTSLIATILHTIMIPINWIVYPFIYKSYFFIIAFLIYSIYGFLIGWGIHSLIRRLRK